MSLLKEKKIRFIKGIINEDLAFGFEVFMNARKVGFFNGVVFYRHREGSISCAKTFSQHSNTLLFRSYKTNADFLLSLLEKDELRAIFPLIERCLKGCSSMPVLCWIKDKHLCSEQELSPLVPYMKWKTRLAYTFSSLARVARAMKHYLRKRK